MLSLTKLYDLSVVAVRDVTVRMLTTVQRERPEAVVVGIATLFILICARYKVDVRRVLETTDRILKDFSENHPVEYRALKTYLDKELPND